MWRVPYRLFSSFVDDAFTTSNVLFELKRGFSDTGERLPPTYEGVKASLAQSPSRVRWEDAVDFGSYKRIPLEVPAVGAETWFDYRRAPSNSADTLIIHHHGLGEVPHDLPPKLMFMIHSDLKSRCDWIAIKGLYHDRLENVSRKLLGCRNTFFENLIVSANIAKVLARDLRSKYKFVVMTGISMGGLITLVENIEDSQMDLSVPYVAGPNLPDVMFNSAFSRLLHGAYKRDEKQAPWLYTFDMTWRLARGEGPPIRPLLARSDRLFRHRVQRACYNKIPRAQVTSFEGGHLTGAANILQLAWHLHRQLDTELWRPSSSLPSSSLPVIRSTPVLNELAA